MAYIIQIAATDDQNKWIQVTGSCFTIETFAASYAHDLEYVRGYIARIREIELKKEPIYGETGA